MVVTAYGIKRSKQSLGYAIGGKAAGIDVLKQEELLKKITMVKARKNFNETAFFYPQLRTDRKGKVSFNFTIPEALTKWKLQLLAHTKKLQAASKSLTTITQKELTNFFTENITEEKMFDKPLEFYRKNSPEHEKIKVYLKKSGF